MLGRVQAVELGDCLLNQKIKHYEAFLYVEQLVDLGLLSVSFVQWFT
ncbi:MAG: hypothetical protein L0L58_00880 [Tetragenococcus koreensis]|nr:hypothetical protein [Tetragenococcus koreensis]